jgi:hypothetical protein
MAPKALKIFGRTNFEPEKLGGFFSSKRSGKIGGKT